LATIKQLEAIDRLRKEKFAREHKIINGVDHKFCNKHHIYFPEEDIWFPSTLEFFHNSNKNKTDGLHPWCKRCASDKSSINYLENRERSDLAHKKYEGSEKHKAWSARNYQMFKDKQSQWRKDNPEKCREYSKQHRIHDITEAEWKKELEVFNYECAYCGISEEESIKILKQRLHKDHGDHLGANDLRNSIPACRSCNSKKHQDDIDDWYKNRKFYTEERYNKIIWWLTEGYKDYIEDKPPYRIIRKQNEGRKDFHWELWTVDEMRNMMECIDIKGKRKEIIKDIEGGILDEYLMQETAK